MIEDATPAAIDEDTPEEKLLRAAYSSALKIKVKFAPPPPSSSSTQTTTNAQTTTTTKRLRVLQHDKPAPAATPDLAPPPAPTLDPANFLLQSDWISSEQTSPLIVELAGLVLVADAEAPPAGKNSIVMSITMPLDSERFAVNVCATRAFNVLGAKNPHTRILYHFNPRGKKIRNGKPTREYIVQDSFDGTAWLPEADKSIRGFPITLGKPFSLRITVVSLGYEVYIDNVLVSEFRHNRALGPPPSPFFLIVPVAEDSYGDKENCIVHSLWWGYLRPTSAMALQPHASNMPASALAAFSTTTGGTTEYEDRTLYVTGLSKGENAMNDMRRLFEHYQVDERPDKSKYWQVHASDGSGLVRIMFEANLKRAIEYLNGKNDVITGNKLVVVRAKRRPGTDMWGGA